MMLVQARIAATSETWEKKAQRVAAVVSEAAPIHDADDSFVAEGYAALKDERMFSALVPEEFGGGGASIAEMCEAIRVIAKSCGSTALAFSMHCHQVAIPAWRLKHQKAPSEALLKRIAAEELVLVSSGGNDWLQSGGEAVKVDGGFRVTARKPFASGSVMGDLLMTSAIYDDPREGPVVLHFGVPLTSEAVTLEPTWQVMGMRGTGSNDIVITNFFLPDGAVGGRRPFGEWHMLFHIISKVAFAFVYSAYIGIAEQAAAEALASARKRRPNTGTALLAGELENELLAARLAHQRMVQLAENAEPGPETTSEAMAARTLAGSHSINAVTKALELAGGGAFYRRNPIERAFRDIQAARFHPLQEKPQLEFSGRVALGWDIND
jgi:alkylation response protein AidB-like acyl-CoA dehydrogenase